MYVMVWRGAQRVRRNAVFKHKQFNLLSLLTCLTLFFIFAQGYLFIVHYKISDLIDSLVGASIALQLLHLVILLPIMSFVLLQIMAYALFTGWIWFITTSMSEWFKLSKPITIRLGLVIWCIACYCMLELNRYYYPDSHFANVMTKIKLFGQYGEMILWMTLAWLVMMTVMSYIHFLV